MAHRLPSAPPPSFSHHIQRRYSFQRLNFCSPAQQHGALFEGRINGGYGISQTRSVLIYSCIFTCSSTVRATIKLLQLVFECSLCCLVVGVQVSKFLFFLRLISSSSLSFKGSTLRMKHANEIFPHFLR